MHYKYQQVIDPQNKPRSHLCNFQLVESKGLWTGGLANEPHSLSKRKKKKRKLVLLWIFITHDCLYDLICLLNLYSLVDYNYRTNLYIVTVSYVITLLFLITYKHKCMLTKKLVKKIDF